MKLRPRRWVVAATVVSALLAWPAPASAQSSWEEAFHVTLRPGTPDPEAAELCGDEFADRLNGASFVERASEELRAAISDCVGEVGGPQALEACLVGLSATTVDYVVFVDAANESGVRVFRAEVFDTRRAAYIWSRDDISREPSARLAAREVCDALGATFVTERSTSDNPGSGAGEQMALRTTTQPATADPYGVLEMIGTTPRVITVSLDGTVVGTSDRPTRIPTGGHELELSAPGYATLRVAVDVRDGAVATLRNIVLEPLPARVALTTHPPAATIIVDGLILGQSGADGSATFDVEPGAHVIEVRSPGYDVWRQTVDLAPDTLLVSMVDLVPRGQRGCEPGFALVRAGSFTMGTPPGEVGRRYDENLHEVTLTRSVCVSETEVTQAQWTELMGASPSDFSHCGPDCPVDRVTWYEALAYANALSEAAALAPCYELLGCHDGVETGLVCSSVHVAAPDGDPLACEGYRLPSESEWEYAARAGTQTANWAGNLQSPAGCDPQPTLEPGAWYCENSSASFFGAFDCSPWRGPSTCGAQSVATRAPNPWGLHDMLGNVSEWCWDGYAAYPGAATDPLGQDSSATRVYRGGGWNQGASSARAGSRSHTSPANRMNALGLRVVRTESTRR